ELWELAEVAKREGLEVRVRQSSFDPCAQDLPEAWQSAFERFLRRHGHRGLNEMEFAAPTWRTDPTPLVGVLRTYLQLTPGSSPPATLTRQGRERQELA